MVKLPDYISAGHYEGIGRVAVASAILETSMLIALQALLGTTKPKAIIAFWHAAFKDKLARVQALSGMARLSAKDKATLKVLAKKMDDAMAKRNLVLHSVEPKPGRERHKPAQNRRPKRKAEDVG